MRRWLVVGRCRRGMRMRRRYKKGRGGGGAQEAITNMIILGYVVGDGNFVGEWRMAASDPVRPGWCGPVFMCRRREEDDDELHGQGGGVRFEPVGGEAV